MSDSKDLWTVGDVLHAMSRIPDHIVRIMHEVQDWLENEAIQESEGLLDLPPTASDRAGGPDIEYLFTRLEWAESIVDLLPAVRRSFTHDEAVILSVGPIVLDEGLRMMVDHAALFASDICRRIWVIADAWIIGDILAYLPHIKAIAARGIELRFMLVTPWGYSEIPWRTGR